MLRVALFFFALAGGLYYLAYIDRKTPLALTVVEYNDIGLLPLFSLTALVGGVFVLLHLRGRWAESARKEAAAARGPRPPTRLHAVSGGRDNLSFRDRVLSRARSLPMEAGARLEVDPAQGVPLRLVLEEMPPGRARRAIDGFGLFLASLPTPPRVQVDFVRCPPPPQPLTVLVQGALSQHLPRNSFKATGHADRVDVLFFEHDPTWREDW